MNKKYDSRIKLTIPNVGYIEIAGTSAFVGKFFDYVKMEFYDRLSDALKTFKGNYEVVETSDKNNVEISVVAK